MKQDVLPASARRIGRAGLALMAVGYLLHDTRSIGEALRVVGLAAIAAAVAFGTMVRVKR